MLRALVLLIVTGCVSLSAAAHDARPISLEVTQVDAAFIYTTRLKVPDAIDRPPLVSMPEGCQAADERNLA